MPLTIGIAPRITKKSHHCSVPFAVRLSRPMKTTTMANTGIIESTVSALPLLVVSVMSVSQVLNAASLADDPTHDITQSMMTMPATSPLSCSGE